MDEKLKNVFTFTAAKGLGANLLGNKGYGLVQMVGLGLPVPDGFIITTEICKEFFKTKLVDANVLPAACQKEITAAADCLLEQKATMKVSVRSGAPVSMPGMMDTKLNIPLADKVKVYSAIMEVFHSWNSPRAIAYREREKIDPKMGTACVVQRMVSGKGMQGGTGVIFTRNPETGEREVYGEWLPDAFGEELVSGKENPLPFERFRKGFPLLAAELGKYGDLLEAHFHDMQEIEFTVEKGKLWLLQTRRGIRKPAAARKIALDLHSEGIIDKIALEQRLSVIPKGRVSAIPTLYGTPIISGTPASDGIAIGQAVLSAEKAVEMKEKGKDVILVRMETSPMDILGFESAVGVLTARGGVTSHAAVLARGMGLPCVVGVPGLQTFLFPSTGGGIPYFLVDGHKVLQGDLITIDGKLGRLWLGDASKEEKAA